MKVPSTESWHCDCRGLLLLGRTKTNQKRSAGALRGTKYFVAILIDLPADRGSVLHRVTFDLVATDGETQNVNPGSFYIWYFANYRRRGIDYNNSRALMEQLWAEKRPRKLRIRSLTSRRGPRVLRGLKMGRSHSSRWVRGELRGPQPLSPASLSSL